MLSSCAVVVHFPFNIVRYASETFGSAAAQFEHVRCARARHVVRLPLIVGLASDIFGVACARFERLCGRGALAP